MNEQHTKYHPYEPVTEDATWEELPPVADAQPPAKRMAERPHEIVWNVERKRFKTYPIAVQIGETGAAIVLYVFLKFGQAVWFLVLVLWTALVSVLLSLSAAVRDTAGQAMRTSGHGHADNDYPTQRTSRTDVHVDVDVRVSVKNGRHD
ncbi:hypothetical protein [Phaeodactylibacter sp.]|uniref:hypothetical protein n=1 Tax=Phaeodactylibacter sp. TaxID=1940289 RepID=UPI0025CE6EAB|nr:hypothetical protein [Phaeodactylibacter sp.]MCI4650829.1 SUR7/PalI family protein [Phaeodactylibacter sp.]MCI5089786.1 SUR7/PalI family protein [Phaeodactylibacter sp.]